LRLSFITTDKNFSAFFWTQFLGAFNDNFFKNSLLMLIAYRGVTVMGLDEKSLVALSGGIFILPFFLFSPLAGLISDKYEKSKIMRVTKLWEVAVMIIAAIGIYFSWYGPLLLVLFFMGLQSTFFGPVKYSILPSILNKDDLTEGNAYVIMGTYVAILAGTIVGGISTKIENIDSYIGIALIAVAVVGYFTSRGVGKVKVGDPDLTIQSNPLPEFKKLYKICRQSPAVWNSVLGISWFWFFGAGVLSVLPIYCKDFLGADQSVATLFLAMFTVGIGIGSVLAEKLSFKRVEIGLVPIGSLGMTLFLVALYFIRPTWPISADNLISMVPFLETTIGWSILITFLVMCIFCGLFIVPLNTLVQERADSKNISRVIAGNNIINSLFMVVSSLTVMLFYSLDMSTPQIFLAFGVMNIIVAVYIYSIVPEFTLRFYSWILSNILYRVKTKGLENIPHEGGVFLASNHVTFVDWLIIYGACKRPARFVMHNDYFEIPIAKWILKQAKVIPIASARENSKLLQSAFEQMSNELNEGEVVIIFPEGHLTNDGTLQPFRPGISKAMEKDPVPVVPVTLKGFWGSSFSRASKGFLPKQFRRPVEVTFLPALPPDGFDLNHLESVVAKDLGETPPHKKSESEP
tara:strand:+ start:153094 stop:154989 length:1896 start_codon:yes stop_codon:yes gene_type:complete